MAAKLTQDQVLLRFKETHGDKYDYSLFKYVNARTRVKIICKEHGIFEQLPFDHARCSGCQKCHPFAFSKSTKQFIIDAKKVHGDRYTYERVEYLNSHSKVEVTCRDHGSFRQTPRQHCNGKGCPKCKAEKTSRCLRKPLSHYIELASKIHGTRYTYQEVFYQQRSAWLKITCPEHGQFTQKASNHASTGYGCPVCGGRGFNNSQSGYFYIISDGDITKVGISNSKVDSRLSNVKRSSGINFKPVKSYFIEDGDSVRQLEREIIKFMRSLYTQPTFKFDGYTECFYGVDICMLLNHTENKIREMNEESKRKA